VAANRGRTDEAMAHWEERLRLQRELGDEGGLAATMRGIGQLHFRRGDVEAASMAFEEGLEMAVQAGDVPESIWCLEDLAAARHGQGRHAAGARLLGAVRSLREAHEMPPLEDAPRVAGLLRD